MSGVIIKLTPLKTTKVSVSVKIQTEAVIKSGTKKINKKILKVFL